jgi:cation diffusion facilitator family transporter
VSVTRWRLVLPQGHVGRHAGQLQLQKAQIRDFGGTRNHGHGHGHTGVPDDAGRQITLVGTGVNAGLIVAKLSAGVAGNSAALIADAGHSLGDLVSDAVVLWALRISSRPPDVDHPYGHGKFEALGSLAVSGLLMTTGVGIGWHSLQILEGSMASTGHQPEVTALAAGVAMVSILAKEQLFRRTLVVGQEINSPVIIANAHHHRSDALSSVVALGGICGSMAGFPLLDPVAGAAVSLMIVNTGKDIGFEAAKQLTDTAPEAEGELMEAVKAELNGMAGAERNVRSWSHLRARWSGPVALIDLHIVVDPQASVSAAHTVRAARGRLGAISVSLCKSVVYGAFVWASRALKHQKRRFPARADRRAGAEHADLGGGARRERRGTRRVRPHGRFTPPLIQIIQDLRIDSVLYF